MKLTYSDLDASFYINSFIKQIMPDKRYEDWIIELVNQSSYFLNKSGGELYIRPPHESHGECDCESSTYKVDFKLVGSKDFYQAKKELSPSYKIDEDNKLQFLNGKGYKKMLHYNLHELVQKCSLEDIEMINRTEEERICDKEKSIIKAFVNILNVEKNAIFVIPALFTYGESKLSTSELADKAAQKVFNAFDSCIKFRNIYSDKESYWAFFYEYKFCIYSCSNNKEYKRILLIDACDSKMFKEIYDLVNCKYY